MIELQVIMSLAHINWLVQNFGARNDLVANCISPDTYFIVKGRVAPDYWYSFH